MNDLIQTASEPKMFVAQNPMTEVFQLVRGENNGGIACFCPFAIPFMNPNGQGIIRSGCETGCPHASCSPNGDGRWLYKMTCGGVERVYDCAIKLDKHTANEGSPKIHRI